MANVVVQIDEFEWLDSDGVSTYDGWTEAVFASLFTDKRDESQVPGERRGWWGDDLGESTELGSNLWTYLDRGKLDRNTAPAVRDEATKALGWLVADGFAQSVNVETEGASVGILSMGVTIVKGVEPIELGITV